ncbi:MAG TPA: hypothetical protein VHD34_11835 [Xanthobacteraceae bacterium]|nr:hypothetical protein [Xanthobacteraceae bacterium]
MAAGFAANSAHAASFDCRKARMPDEVAICHHRDLSELDAEMGALWFSYRQLPFLMGMNGARRDDAGTFLSKRAACGPRVECLRALYRARNKALREDITAAMREIKREQQQ